MEGIDPHECTAIVCHDDGELHGVWLRRNIQMQFRDPDPIVRRLQEMIMGRARVMGATRMMWRVATDEQWGKFMLRMITDDKKIERLA